MLEIEHARGSNRAEQHQIHQMTLHALDAWVREPSVLTDALRLRAILRSGADAGRATVVGEEFFVFPNGAVTGVLLLAQSHLSIHTWPEFGLANVEELGVARFERVRIPRAIG